MKKTPNAKSKGKRGRPKTKLGIPDLEMSKPAVLRSLASPDSRRGYQHAIDEFVAWYCSEPLEERGLAPGTINVRKKTGDQKNR
jgi:hypothetical protein